MFIYLDLVKTIRGFASSTGKSVRISSSDSRAYPARSRYWRSTRISNHAISEEKEKEKGHSRVMAE